ncbi:MAG: alginate lyase family protein [Kiritimatiellaeota bacterium]|nr:alginate lyase family protein [Kiritimatiellota bacterium]
MKRSAIALLSCLAAVPALAQGFAHPGVLHTREGMDRMRRSVAGKAEPAYGSYRLLAGHKCSQSDYVMEGPFAAISRDGEFRHTKGKMEADFSAAYQNALMWILSGDEAHAQRSLAILAAYADTLREIPDTNDAPLLAGLEGFKIVYALEALKHTWPGADAAQLAAAARMFKTIFIPVMERFYAREPYTNGNWGPVVTKAYMAAAIHLDDRAMYAKARDFYLHARDNGTIAHYISGETGQVQESGRDQPHCMLGLGAMATVCELAWQQGDDLYFALDNRLMKGYEYVARYNLGHDVPFARWTDVTGKYCRWAEISESGRGRFMPVFEIAHNHFAGRKGLPMPYTAQVLGKTRPEGHDRDQPGFGTLLFANEE